MTSGGCARTRAVTDSEGPATWTEIGRSAQGRPIEAVTLGSGSSGTPRVLVIGGIHGDEQEGAPAVEALLADGSWRRGATVRIIRDANPDGTAAGTRFNSRGVDLNRNWPASNFKPSRSRGRSTLSEPETAAVHADILAFRPAIVVVFHSARGGPFVNFDGPAAELAGRFGAAAARADPRWRVVAQMGYATPGSLGSYLGVDCGVPILTVEFQRGHEAGAAAEAAIAGLTGVIVGDGMAGAAGDAGAVEAAK